ncbi:hypothetical protein AYX07_08015 [Thermoactinomyces sp. AS95]|uniref:amino acid permease n=1 Tax=Thermoactinomyces sp. AS95 TaxID=1811386 RepID=UPI0007A04529|nr:amino acid permease [Thermoactinomyces sp. AS95]KYQ87051.1 hypothetical protein AYX07_08015 [Thermoactinomyces sp. AS95]
MSREPVGAKEDVLQRELTPGQLTMIGLGSAIGTGLFIGSSLAIHYAGPGVIVSYALISVIVFMMVFCLAKLSMEHPTTGSFGIHAEKYLHPWLGYLVRYTYWAANAIAIGGEATAVGIYMQYWFPEVPRWIFVVAFSLMIILINALSVKNFGMFEFGFSTVKVTALSVFIVLGLLLIFAEPAESMNRLAGDGQFAPQGWFGIWMGMVMASFSFMGTEIVAVTAGEAKEPRRALSKTMKWMALRLILFYLLSMAVMLALIPWQQIGGEQLEQSPFVKMLQLLNIPYAAGLMNFIVLTAALSTMNANLYACTRMIFSLAKSEFAPEKLGKVTRKGVPVPALIISSFGLMIAILLNVTDAKAYQTLFGIAIFGGIFTWMIIFLTYFRYQWLKTARFSPVATIGFVVLLLVFITMFLHPAWKYAIYIGVFWVMILSVFYGLQRWRKAKKQE